LTSNIVIDESSWTGIDTLDVYEDLTTGPSQNTVTSDLILNTDGSLTFAFLESGVSTGSFTIKGAIEIFHDYGISSGGNFDTLIKVWTAANGVGTLAANVTNTGGIGSNNADTMTGSSLNDQIWGFGGNDAISGGAGNDKLAGGDGNDTLIGGQGNDTLIGGTGKDIFVFNTALGNTNIDAIIDFEVGTDKIQLNKSIFTALGANLNTGFVSGSAATASTDRIIYDKSSGKLFYDDDGSGTASSNHAQVQIAIFGTDKHPDLHASDFVIY